MSPSFEFLEEPAYRFARRAELSGDRFVGRLEPSAETGRALDEPAGEPRIGAAERHLAHQRQEIGQAVADPAEREATEGGRSFDRRLDRRGGRSRPSSRVSTTSSAG